jgi:ABC-type multidrug transport system ATPase subunit
MADPSVSMHALRKEFGHAASSVRAVDGLTLAIPPGEIYGLLGPNGAGKTTALRMLAGLLTPSSGRAMIMGVEVGLAPKEAKKRLGFLSASTGLHARLTPREVLAYFGNLHGMTPASLERRVMEVSRLLDLRRLLDRRCEGLSTGERQRVSLARAVLHDPPVLILDEPTSGLDVLASRFLRDFVRAERERGKAIVFSTHYLAEAELLCDRIGLLFQGRLLREGTPTALRAEVGAATLEEAFLTLVGMTETHPAPRAPQAP